MSNNFKLYPHGRYILTERDVTNTFDFKSYPSSNREKNEVLRTYDLYSIFEALVSDSDRYIYQNILFPNNRHYNITMTEFILDQDPFTDNNAGAIIRQAKDSSSGKLTMKKTSSDTNVLDLEYSPNDTFILYKYNDNIYNSSNDTEGDIFYYFTDDYNPIKNSKCIIISNSRTNGLSKRVDYLPSGSSRTDSFLDPHFNNLVYKSDLPTPINNIKDGSGQYSIKSSNLYAGALGKYSIAFGDQVYAYGDYSQALGNNTKAGTRGFSVASFDASNKTYTLNSIYNLRIGMKCYALISIQNGNNNNSSYNLFSGEITAIDSNTKTITVTEFIKPFNLGTGSNDYSYYIVIEDNFNLGDTTITSIDCSHAEGKWSLAFGQASHAEGNSTKAIGKASHAEGWDTTASGHQAHAEGSNTIASGTDAHAEGGNTIASGLDSHAEGIGTIASGTNQHVQGKFNIEDTSMLHIVGNGDYDSHYEIVRSNAHTIDWHGNAWFAGDVYTGSTSGTNKDSGSKKLATEEYVTNLVSDTGWITSTTTSSNGVCTYNAGNAGGELQIRKIGKIAYLNLALRLDLSIDTAIDGQYLLTLNEKYRPIQTIYFTTLLTCRDTSECNQLCTVAISPDGKVKLPNHIEIARKQTEYGSQSLYLNHLVSYPV
jgi:hypothetical protein